MSWSKLPELFTQILKTWQVHLEKRRELYQIQLQKKKDKALDAAENMAETSRNFMTYVYKHLPLSKEQKKDLQQLEKRFALYKKRFDKYD
jgi:hypothetical protein